MASRATNCFITDAPSGTSFSYGISWTSAKTVGGLHHFSGYDNRDDGTYTVEYTTDIAAEGLNGLNVNTSSCTWLPLISPGTFSISGTPDDGRSDLVQSYFFGGAISGVTAIRITSTNADVAYGSVTEVQVIGVPEPNTIVLFAGGLIGLVAYAWRKRKCVPS